MKSRGIVWFRNDLRLRDHEALQNAIKKCDEILPVYIIDERMFARDRYGFLKTGPFRTQFLLDSLKALDHALRQKGGLLYVEKGTPETILPRLAKLINATTLFAHKEVTSEEVAVEQKISDQMEVEWYWGSTLYHPDDIPFDRTSIPDIFTEFRKQIEKQALVRNVIPEPEILVITPIASGATLDALFSPFEKKAPDPRTAFPFHGGSANVRRRLEDYLWKSQKLSHYKFTRNGLLGLDYSSKFSPWLANGSMSPREIYWEVVRYEKAVKKNISTYWMKFELIWRDYFRFVALKYGDGIFHRSGLKKRVKNWSKNEEDYERWRKGETGIPFIDANMNELALTGWMSNRGRQNAASYLAHDLGIDWRWGAAWFESLLLDYDPCSNYGNWMYVAGVGNDPRENRRFDIEWQAKKYDPEGEFINHWLKK